MISKIKLLYLLILGIVFVIFLLLAYLNTEVKRQLSGSEIYISPLTFSAEDYPVTPNGIAPQVSAQGAVVLDRASQVVLYEKNPNLRFAPASTTKIMTALVALEHFNPDDILTIYQTTVEGTSIGFGANEKFRFEDLLYAMLLPSANDATLAIAQNYPGGEEAFVSKMNEKAKKLALVSTHYEDSVGLLDEKDYTTPLDLARLASVALENPEFAKVVATKNREISSLKGNQYILYNLNKLLDLPGVSGVKTGTTAGAGQVLVTSRKTSEGRELIVVVMQSQDRFSDTENLLNFLGNLNYLSIHP